MKVSIITVVYNGAKTIERTIQSVISQTYKNIEYIIIDGKSTDNTLEIIEKYRKYIACVVSESDKGIYDAMNKGILKATGEIVGIINSDDYYESDAIEKVVDYFYEAETDILYGKVKLIYENGYIAVSDNLPLEQLNFKMIIQHPSVFVKRSLYKQYGAFDLRYSIAADYDFLLRLYNQGVKFCYVDDVIAAFDMTGTSNKELRKATEEFREIALYYMDTDEKKDKYLDSIENLYHESMEYIEGIKQRNDLLINNNAETIGEFINSEKVVFIWGCGKNSNIVYNLLKLFNISIKGYIDNDPIKWGKKMGDYDIYAPGRLLEKKEKVVVATKKYVYDISEQLDEMNYVLGKDYITINELQFK